MLGACRSRPSTHRRLKCMPSAAIMGPAGGGIARRFVVVPIACISSTVKTLAARGQLALPPQLLLTNLVIQDLHDHQQLTQCVVHLLLVIHGGQRAQRGAASRAGDLARAEGRPMTVRESSTRSPPAVLALLLVRPSPEALC